MLNGIASVLHGGDRRLRSLRVTAEEHAINGLPAVTWERYEGGFGSEALRYILFFGGFALLLAVIGAYGADLLYRPTAS